MRRRITPILIALAVLLAPHAAPATTDLHAAIDRLRSQGCSDHRGVEPALRPDPRLDRVAQARASGQSVRKAMMDAGYRAAQSVTLEVSGSDDAIARALAKRGCADVLDPLYRDVGVAQSGDTAWIILAAPLASPAAGHEQAVSRRVLELVNEARAGPRRCGWKRFDAASPLLDSKLLRTAALGHARDMAEHGSLSHAGHDGSTPAERAARAGYKWRTVGENIASGQATPEQVVAEWLDSPRHCANLMDADYTEMGVAFAVAPPSVAGIYWSQVLAAPRPGT